MGAGRVKKFRKVILPFVYNKSSQQTLPKKPLKQESHHPQTRTPNVTEDVELASSSHPPHSSEPEPHPHPHTRGYPALANFIGSDKDFFIFRRFASLSARNLLYLQDELSELEGKLLALDRSDSRSSDQIALWNLHSRREDRNVKRKVLMGEVRCKLKEYRMQKQLFHTSLKLLILICRTCFIFSVPYSFVGESTRYLH